MIGKRAGVSKSDFYKQFESKDACFVAAYDDAVERIRERVLAACGRLRTGPPGCSPRSPRCSTCSPPSRPRRELVLVEGLRAGRGVYDRYQEAPAELRAVLREARRRRQAASRRPRRPTRPSSAASPRCWRGACSPVRPRSSASYLPEIAEFALTPYVGAAEARRIISER